MSVETYRCDDCDVTFVGRPYYTAGEDEDEPICPECAGPFLCPDYHADQTPDHAAVCIAPEGENR